MVVGEPERQLSVARRASFTVHGLLARFVGGLAPDAGSRLGVPGMILLVRLHTMRRIHSTKQQQMQLDQPNRTGCAMLIVCPKTP